MRINNNTAALNAWKTLSQTDTAMGKSLEKLSSGFRINRAGDDAAGLAISEKMRSQIRGLNTAMRNAQDGISLIQTAEGALTETHSILQRVRELTVQAANGTNADNDLTKIKNETDALMTELTDISTRTQFNGKNLLDGSLNVMFQIGANSDQFAELTIDAMGASALGLKGTVASGASAPTGGIDPTLITGSNAAAINAAFQTQLTAIDDAIESVSAQRSSLGALQNRLEYTINNLAAASENLTAAESRIRDVDMAHEMMNFTKNQILTQAGTAMLAQANQKPQSVLQLLG